MARSLTSDQKIQRARALIQEARDLVKFIPDRVSANDELKNEARSVMEEADQAEQEILH